MSMDRTATLLNGTTLRAMRIASSTTTSALLQTKS